MPKSRNIKPQFFTDEKVLSLSDSAKILFIGILINCDDSGVHPYSLWTLKVEVFPADRKSIKKIESLVHELSTAGLIEFYNVDQKKYIYIPTFSKHQNIPPDRKFYLYPLKDGKIPKRTKKSKSYNGGNTVSNTAPNSEQTQHEQCADNDEAVSEQCPNGSIREDKNKIKKRKEKGSNAPAGANTPLSEILYNFKTSNGTAKIRSDYVDELVSSYKNLDVFHQLGRMQQWLNDEANRRPTPKSLKAWIRKWLSTAQEEATANEC